jgi:hypothetical protein
MRTDHLHIAYLSRLAPTADYTVFAAIARAARQRNAVHGIAGALLFDGLQFFHWLYGPPDAVSALMRNIVGDMRHVALSVIFESLLPHDATHDRQFRTGFVDGDALDELLGDAQLAAPVFLDLMQRLLARADVDPPSPPAFTA